MTSEEGSPSQPGNDASGDVPNASGTPGVGLFSFGHRAIRIGVGTVFLGLDQVHALLEHAVKRGERVEVDTQRAAADLHRWTTGTTQAAASGVYQRSTAAWSSGLASVMNRLPGVSLTYKPPESAGGPASGEASRQSVAQVEINDFERGAQQEDLNSALNTKG